MENGSCIDNSINKPVKLSEIDIQNMDWMTTTNGFGYIGVSNVIKAIGVTNEEKRSLIEILCKEARENNITLESNVFELMEQNYVLYGGSKATFGVIGRMKLKNLEEKIDVISKVDNMTQGEILTAMAPIDTMISICKDNCGKPLLVLNDVNMIIPFVVKAQKAAEKISRFALDHFNSRDEHKRELSKLICGRFQTMLVEMDNVTFNGYKNDTTVDWLNNNVRSVTDLLFNTIEACENLVDDLDKTSAQKNAGDKQSALIAELEKEVNKLESENAELKAKLALRVEPTTDKTIEQYKKEIKDLNEELESIKKQDGKVFSKQAAILTLTACYHGGGLPNNRENLYPILTELFGVGESLAKRRLREGIKQEEAEKLAKYFVEVAPKIARIIIEMPEKLKNNKNKRSHM